MMSDDAQFILDHQSTFMSRGEFVKNSLYLLSLKDNCPNKYNHRTQSWQPTACFPPSLENQAL